MSEIKGHMKIENGSERSFGIVFAFVFGIIAVLPILHGTGDVRLWACAVGAVFLILAFGAPKLLSIPNKLWFKLGLALGAIVAPVVMALVYCVAIVPIGLLMRISGKDILQQKIDRNMKSYWIKRSQPVSSMQDQF